MNERLAGGLWCRDVLVLLDDFVDARLEPDRLTSVLAHLAECDECSRFGTAYAGVVAALRSGTQTPLGAERLQRLNERLEGEV